MNGGKEEKHMMTLNNENNDKYTQVIADTLGAKDKPLFRKQYLALHPSDQVDVFVSLNETQRNVLYSFLEPKEFALVFSGLYFIHQEATFKELSHDYLRSEEHTSELQSRFDIVCRLLLEKTYAQTTKKTML